jgi:hypothetical protein
VTTAFQTYEADKTQTNLAAAFRTWRTTGAMRERSDLSGAADNLRALIEKAEKANIVIVRVARDVGTISLYELLQPVPANVIRDCGGAISPDRALPALLPTEINKINEAFMRARAAAGKARDALTRLSPKVVTGRSLAGQPIVAGGARPADTPTMRSYTKFFGARDQARFSRVLTGFEAICERQVSSTDLRSMSFTRLCQPGPEARSLSTTARSRRSETSTLVGRFCLPRVRRYSATNSGCTSRAGRKCGRSGSVTSQVSGSASMPR